MNSDQHLTFRQVVDVACFDFPVILLFFRLTDDQSLKTCTMSAEWIVVVNLSVSETWFLPGTGLGFQSLEDPLVAGKHVQIIIS